MDAWIDTLRKHPELAFFLTLGIGYLIGKIKIFKIPLGAVTGVLIAGVFIGQLKITIGPEFKSALLLLFLFSIGYKVGPQFFKGMKSTGLLQAGLTILFCFIGLAVVYGLAKMVGLDPGTSAGLIGGALTESAALGAATEAIGKLQMTAEQAQVLINNATVSFAVTYFLGVLTVVFFLSQIAPKLLKVDLPAECKKLEEEMGSKEESPDTYMAYQDVSVRAYKVPKTLDGVKVADLEKRFAAGRVFVDRVHRGEEIFLGSAEQVLKENDIVAVSGKIFSIVDKSNPLRGLEVEDKDLLQFEGENLEVILTNKKLDGKTIAELAASMDSRGVFLISIKRGGHIIPFLPKTKIELGDILELSGAKWHVERVVPHVGQALRAAESSEMISVMVAILFGALIGIPAIAWGPIQVGLSLAVGVLIGGLIIGWLHSTRPSLGQIPKSALWIFDSLGLCGFLAITAMSVGPEFFRGLKESGLLLVGLGLVTVIVPHLITLLVGRYVFKVHPGILLGICAGAGTSAPALAAIQEVAKSKIPTLGYGITYAIGNVFLALWGSVIVFLIAK